ncbi:hypothetical protein CY34DRAFT_11521 [Suillus luteus UH-Slu-Lm8-n1]|uniref:Metallo-beta-lactamase domain-containing protein n=1 Tax=Suillus luteus UH-Slu-Lm8-n1 TaxID=930992 RepID=A0A0D0B153_9AGAM|nr:hypothetical protein CY34DRAFT_11521 [Suillus luteus UH-Slu-Lm8-n1]
MSSLAYKIYLHSPLRQMSNHLILAGEELDEPMVCPSLPSFLRHSKRDPQQHKRVCACCNGNVLACREADSGRIFGGRRSSTSFDMPSVLREGSKEALADPGSAILQPLRLFAYQKTVHPSSQCLTYTCQSVPISAQWTFQVGDGSMNIIDASGHVDGHIDILARTSSDGTWILLGADSAHHPDLITGMMQIAYRVDASTCSAMCAHEDKEVAEKNIRKIRLLFEVPRVQVLIAHDT